MSMFDSVIAICPNCQHFVEFQSKAGECELRRYTLGAQAIPAEIALDLINCTESCQSCGKKITLRGAISLRLEH